MIICHTREDREKCTMQLVETVASNAKFHLSQDRTNQSTATNVFQTINQQAEEAQVVEDLEAEVAAEVV